MSTTNTHFLGKPNFGLHFTGMRKFLVFVFGLMLTATLISCGGGADTRNTEGSIPPDDTQVVRGAGGNEREDVRAFKINFWQKLNQSNRCGQCHGVRQSPKFVDLNIANAFSEAVSVTDMTNPANSLLVTKVASGHNCWVADASVCATEITAYIDAWINGIEETSTGREIQLEAPSPDSIRDPGTSKNFPTMTSDFTPEQYAAYFNDNNNLHDLLVARCSSCHAETASTPQAPYFANADEESAYQAAKIKIDLNNPANSRLVIRLREESHNCWADCGNNADEMEAAIQRFADWINLDAVDPLWVISKAMTLDDAIVASGGQRHETFLLANWEFKEGSGTLATDNSGVVSVDGASSAPLNLTLNGNVTWLGSYGVNIGSGGMLQGTVASSKKLYDFIRSSEEYSIEGWVVPANVVQEDSTILSYSASSTNSNMMLGQTMYNYDFYNRSQFTVESNDNVMSTPDNAEVLQSSLQHVVATYSPLYPVNPDNPGQVRYGRRIYVNGQLTNSTDGVAAEGDTLTDFWDDISALTMGNSPGEGRPWEGRIRQMAIHYRAMTQEQVTQNFEAGVGQKYFMLFSVSERLGIPDSFILFEVSQYDDYSYSFSKPIFISLDDSWVPTEPIRIQGLRIGINGQIADVGQAYANMDVTIDSNSYTANGQVLSELGTIIALEGGASADEFFLAFERLGSDAYTFTEQTFTAPVDTNVNDPTEKASQIGLRTFDEINQTMSDLTGIPKTDVDITTVLIDYRQQLPSIEAMDSFVSAHQMAIAQLAMAYCNELVTNNQTYFTGSGDFSFAVTAGSAFDTVLQRNAIINPLLTDMMNMEAVDNVNGLNLTSQPTDAEIREQLGSLGTLQYVGGRTENYQSLITQMTQCTTNPPETNCDTVARTQEIVTATCAAVLGSSIVHVQ